MAGAVRLEASSSDAAALSAVLQSHDIGRKTAMHVVAAMPSYLSISDVPADVVEQETAIFRYIFLLIITFCMTVPALCSVYF